jgi:hypothetical protein
MDTDNLTPNQLKAQSDDAYRRIDYDAFTVIAAYEKSRIKDQLIQTTDTKKFFELKAKHDTFTYITNLIKTTNEE